MRSLFARIPFRVLLAGQAAVVAGVFAVVTLQAFSVKKKITEMADLKDPSPFTGTLAANRTEIDFAVMSYVQGREPLAGRRIVEADARFRSSLNEFQKNNAALFPPAAQRRIQSAYEPFHAEAKKLQQLADDRRRLWDQMLTDQDDLADLFDRRLRPLIRRGQAHAMSRLDLIANLERELRLIPEAMTRAMLKEPAAAGEVAFHDRKIGRFLSLYDGLVQSPAEKSNVARVRTLWENMSRTAGELAAIESQIDGGIRQLQNASQALQTTLTTALPPIRPEIIASKKNSIFRAIQWTIAVAAILLTGGFGSAIWTGLVMARRIRRAIQEIQSVTEAAASGDLSHDVSIEPASALGPIAASVNRVIAMLRRSEQLALQLGSIVESTGDASIGLSLEGTVLSWNKGAERMYGYKLDEMKGKPVETLFSDHRADDFSQMRQRLNAQRTVTIDTIHQRKSNGRIIVRATLGRILDTTGHPIGHILIVRDIAYWGRADTTRATAA
jgi:PAS domain S-box-containing protein